MACWDRAQARHGLVGGFDAHITGSRLRQTTSVFIGQIKITDRAQRFRRRA